MCLFNVPSCHPKLQIVFGLVQTVNKESAPRVISVVAGCRAETPLKSFPLWNASFCCSSHAQHFCTGRPHQHRPGWVWPLSSGPVIRWHRQASCAHTQHINLGNRISASQRIKSLVYLIHFIWVGPFLTWFCLPSDRLLRNLCISSKILCFPSQLELTSHLLFQLSI